jgi:hypothetical protein
MKPLCNGNHVRRMSEGQVYLVNITLQCSMLIKQAEFSAIDFDTSTISPKKP